MILSGDLQAARSGQRSLATPRRLVAGRPTELGAVTTLDSAGLALLVQMGQGGSLRGATPTLVGASDDFHTLANLYG